MAPKLKHQITVYIEPFELDAADELGKLWGVDRSRAIARAIMEAAASEGIPHIEPRRLLDD